MGESGNGSSALRAAEALLRTAGRWDLKLRLAAPAAAGDDTEQLGLATPLFTDVALGPSVFRNAVSDRVLLVAGSTAARLAGSADADAAEAMFSGAVGVVDGDVLYEITGCEARWAADIVYCYALTLRAPTN